MTSNAEVNIEVVLKDGAYDYIYKVHNSVWDDPIIEHFHLRRVIYDNLNFINIKGEVKNYKTYESLFMDWYKERKKLYKIRVKRIIIILKLQILLLKLKNILYLIELVITY